MMDPLAALFLRYRDRADVDALGEVFDRTAPRLLQLAMHLSSRAADAEDLLQATFVLAMQKAETFDRRQPLLPWLSGILAGEARNLLRKNRRRQAEPLPELCDPGVAPLAAAERSELLAQLRARVDTLPQEQRQVLLLQLQHGLSPAAIAEVLELPPGTVRMRIHRGLQALRKLLPAGLAAWLFGVLPQRGLAAVRQGVLRHAQAGHAAGVASAGAVVGGVLLMKKVLIATVLLCTAVLCWWWAGPERGAVAAPGAAEKLVPAIAAAAGRDEAATGRNTVAGTDADRTAVAATTGWLHVRVTATAGGEVLGAADLPLRLWQGDAELPPLDGSDRIVRTDADGEAVIGALRAGRWRLQPAAGFAAAPVGAVIVAGAESQCELSLTAMAILRGVVVDEDGSPIADAAIRLANLSGVGLSQPPHGGIGNDPLAMRTAARSRADGTFACGCGPSENKVAALHAGYTASPSQLTHVVPRRDLRLTLGRQAGAIGGSVLDEHGAPLGSVLVAAMPTIEWIHRAADGTWLGAPLPELVRSDAGGRFEFAGLLPGKVRLWTGSSGRMPAFAIVEVAAGTRREVELRLQDSVTVSGSVRRIDGSPVTDVTIAARPTKDAAGVMQMARPRGDGGFVLPDLPLRPFWITAHRGLALLAAQPLTPTANGRLRVQLELPELPTLTGRVVDPDGSGLACWWIAAVDADGRHGDVAVSTDADGRFTLRDLQAEHLQLRATWPNGDLRDPAVTVGDVSAHAGRVHLRVAADALPRASVRGRLVDHTGNCLSHATMSLHVEGTDTRYLGETLADGSFAIEAVPAGSFELLAQLADQPVRHMLQLRLGKAEAQDLGEMRLLPQATLHVEFAARGGTPWRAMFPDIDLLEANGHRSPARWHSAEDGFTASVEPGAYRLEISGRDLIAAPQSIDLQPGETRRVRIELAVGRSRALVFAGDRSRPIDPRDVLHLQVMDPKGIIVLRQDVRRSPHGDGDWTFEHTFAFGSFQVEARSDSDRRYAGRFEVGDELGDTMRTQIPMLSR